MRAALVRAAGAQSYRPSGTAAEYTVVPADQAVALDPQAGTDLVADLCRSSGLPAARRTWTASPGRWLCTRLTSAPLTSSSRFWRTHLCGRPRRRGFAVR